MSAEEARKKWHRSLVRFAGRPTRAWPQELAAEVLWLAPTLRSQQLAFWVPEFAHRCAQTQHRQTTLTNEARGASMSYATMYNVRLPSAFFQP